MAKPRSLYDKIWDDHIVEDLPSGESIVYIDRHLIHEVTSPQAFEGLRLNKRKVRRVDACLAVADHNVPTSDIDKPIADPVSRKQVETLRKNCSEFDIRLFSMGCFFFPTKQPFCIGQRSF